MRIIKAKHKAVSEPIADLSTYRAFPTPLVDMHEMDPFLLLNHHGLQKYPAANRGLPFGPHPHRGFETVTFIVEGDLVHKDSSGAVSKIKAGGVQWMRAGKGLVHAETSSDDFRKNGGSIEILQLWVNLPARYKMAAPQYTGLQADEIPVVEWDGGNVKGHVISGTWDGVKAPIQALTDMSLATLEFKKGGKLSLTIDKEKTILLYVVKGDILVNGEQAAMHQLVEFNHEGKIVEMKGMTDALVIFGYATPFHEPIAAHGPFVMNTQEEIIQAFEDYHAGAFGPVNI